jgi:hypothetical protein
MQSVTISRLVLSGKAKLNIENLADLVRRELDVCVGIPLACQEWDQRQQTRGEESPSVEQLLM